MTLLEYIIKKEDLSEMECMKVRYEYSSIEKCILNEVCPSRFKILSGTIYEKPLSRDKENRDSCRFEEATEENSLKYIECWNRKILTI